MMTNFAKEIVGKKIKTMSGIYTVMDFFITEAAGLCLVVWNEENGRAMLNTIRVLGGVEILP
jgi:hypothetical protein